MEYKKLLKAISYASRIHHGQMRVDDTTPYISHPFRVTTILSVVFGIKNINILTTAVLHDSIEDTEANFDNIRKNFGDEIAENVAALTKDMRLPKKDREEEFLQELEEANVAIKLCKLADTLDNLIDTESIDDSKLMSIVAKAESILSTLSPLSEENAAVTEAANKVKNEIIDVELNS